VQNKVVRARIETLEKEEEEEDMSVYDVSL
jgi:hypothetical protein